MFIAKLFYFLFFGAMACLVPYLTLYYQQLGLSGREIGFLTGIVPLTSMAASPVWGMLSDATGRHRLFFTLSMLGTWIAVFLMTRATGFEMLVPIVISYAFFSAPILPLVDNAVVEMLGEENRGEYGRQRVWGSYGWGLAGALMGIIIAASGLQWAFIAWLVVFLILILVSGRLPMSPAASEGTFLNDLRLLLSNRAWLLFIAVALVQGMCLGIILNFLFLYLDTLGTSTAVMGLTLAMATISEIPIFLYSRRLLGRWSTPFLLLVSLLFTVIRSFAYVNMMASWQVLLISLLHGPTYALMWIAGVAYAAESAPRGLGATAQGVFGGITMGLGPAIGSFVGGFLFDAYGPQSVFIFSGISALAAAIFFLVVNRHSFRRQLARAT